MVDKASLGQLDFLGAGGSGDVYAIAGTDTVYKEINAEATAIGGIDWAIGAVDFWRSLPPADRAHLGQIAVWPTEVVTENGTVVGVTMPRIPADFWHSRVDHRGQRRSFDNAMMWLMVERKHLAGRGIDADAATDQAVKITLLAQLTEAIAWLHDRGVVFGDISYSNADFALNPPRILLLDCDAVCTGPATNQGRGRNAMVYRPPEHWPQETTVDRATDCYKLGILVLSVLTAGPLASQRRPQHVQLLDGKVPPRLSALLRAAVHDDPTVRPPVAELAGCLRELASRLTSPPVANLLDLDRSVLRRGDTVVLRWDFDVAHTVTVEVPGVVPLVLDHAAHPTGCSFPVTQSGLVAVHVANRHGTSTYVAGPVAVYDVPTAQVALPDLGLPAAPSVLAGLPAATRVPLPGSAAVAAGVVVGLGRGIDADLGTLRARLRRVVAGWR